LFEFNELVFGKQEAAKGNFITIFLLMILFPSPIISPLYMLPVGTQERCRWSFVSLWRGNGRKCCARTRVERKVHILVKEANIKCEPKRLDVSNITDGIRHDVDILTDFDSVKQQVGSIGRPSVRTRPRDMIVFLWRCDEPFPKGRGRQKMFRLLIFLPLALEFWVSVLKHRYHHKYVHYIFGSFYYYFQFLSVSKEPSGRRHSY
jgi:predicted nucleic acid-binding Zn ribbon protein